MPHDCKPLEQIMKIKQLLFFTFILFNTTIFAQNSTPEFSFGILNADIKTIHFDWSEGNTWRRGFWVTLKQNQKVCKWFGVSTGLTYQERIPLEVFSFNWGLNEGFPGVSTRYTFGKWPNNPQNKMFNKDTYVRFPNFRYINLEVIPNITIGNDFSITIGIGLFGGLLLNRDATTVTKDDLPETLHIFFDPPQNLYGEFTYHRYDFGWIPQLNIDYQINDKFKIGILFKSYQSLIRLNDNFVDKDLVFNMRWIAHAYGLNIQYHY